MSMPRYCLRSLLPLTLLASIAVAEEPEWPPELAEIVAALPDAKQEYLHEEGESFAGTWRKLYTQLKGRSAEEVEAFVDALMYVEEASRFNPDGSGRLQHVEAQATPGAEPRPGAGSHQPELLRH